MEANTSGSMWLHSGHILRIELICLIEKKKKKQVQAFGLCTGKRNLKLTDMEKTTCGLGVRGRLCGTFNGEE